MPVPATLTARKLGNAPLTLRAACIFFRNFSVSVCLVERHKCSWVLGLYENLACQLELGIVAMCKARFGRAVG
jgi:hypothetical protein